MLCLAAQKLGKGRQWFRRSDGLVPVWSQAHFLCGTLELDILLTKALVVAHLPQGPDRIRKAPSSVSSRTSDTFLSGIQVFSVGPEPLGVRSFKFAFFSITLR